MERLVISKARLEQIDEVAEIVGKTISEVYSKYYSDEVVNFFLQIHNHDSICKDIADNNTYVISCEDTILGTGTIHQNTISRVYIHPDNQYKGIGTMLMDYLEKEIIEKYSYVDIDASLPAAKFYINRGYEILTQSEHSVANRKVLSYSIMRKREFEINPALYNVPSILVKKEIELQGLDFDEYKKRFLREYTCLKKENTLKYVLKIWLQ